MRQIYSRSFTATLASGGSRYVFAEKIDPGNILHVHSCSAYSLQREASDNVIIGIRDGAEDLILTAQAPLAIQRGVDAPNQFLVGEGDQVFAYFPDGDDTDTVGIHINGVLVPLKEWENMVE